MVPTDRVGQDQAGAIRRPRDPVCDPATADIDSVGHPAPSTMARIVSTKTPASPMSRSISPRLAAIASGSTSRPATALAVASTAAPAAWKAAGTAHHSACQPPRPRSNSGGRAVRTTVAAPRLTSAAAERSHRVDRVLLSGNARGASRSGSYPPRGARAARDRPRSWPCHPPRRLSAPLAPPPGNGRRAMETADWPDRATRPARRRRRSPGPQRVARADRTSELDGQSLTLVPHQDPVPDNRRQPMCRPQTEGQ